MKRYRLKKSYLFMLFILILGVLVLIFINFFRAKSYTINYNLGDFSVNENFLLEDKVYYINVSYENLDYDFILEDDYFKTKKLVNNIEVIKDDDNACLIISSSYFNIHPLCSENNERVDYRLIEGTLKTELAKYLDDNEYDKDEFENYVIYKSDLDYLVWNYKGFNRIKDGNVKSINIFKKDIYEVPLATKINNYVFIPDYEQKYTFDKAYVINLDNNKVEEWDLKNSISFDSFILGTNNKSIYLVDVNKKKEFEIVPHKKKLRIVSTGDGRGIVYNGLKQERFSLNKIISERMNFSYTNNYNYILEDNMLYLSYLKYSIKMKVSNKSINKLVNISNDVVYYISSDTLYKFSLENGEEPVLEYNELEFNDDNMIIINN